MPLQAIIWCFYFQYWFIFAIIDITLSLSPLRYFAIFFTLIFDYAIDYFHYYFRCHYLFHAYAICHFLISVIIGWYWLIAILPPLFSRHVTPFSDFHVSFSLSDFLLLLLSLLIYLYWLRLHAIFYWYFLHWCLLFTDYYAAYYLLISDYYYADYHLILLLFSLMMPLFSLRHI